MGNNQLRLLREMNKETLRELLAECLSIDVDDIPDVDSDTLRNIIIDTDIDFDIYEWGFTD